MSAFPSVTIEGYPRIGPNRELKKALERFWAGKISAEQFRADASAVRVGMYRRLRELGLKASYAIPADVAMYDQVLETAVTVGLVGEGEDVDLDAYFALARGNADQAPLEMTKWFDTNYHYLVPEVKADQELTPRPQRLISLITEAREENVVVRPYLVGPVTLLALSKAADDSDFSPLDLLPKVVAAYQQVLSALAEKGVAWVQLAEPALVADLSAADDAELARLAGEAYGTLLGNDNRPQVLITTPYGSLRAGLDALVAAGPDALHVDLAPATVAAAPDYPQRVAQAVADTNIQLVAGIIDGRNVWAANLPQRLEVLEQLSPAGRITVSTSVSLQHVPHTLAAESSLPEEVAGWLAFAEEKVAEAVTLERALHEGRDGVAEELEKSAAAAQSRAESARIHNAQVQERAAAVPTGQVSREQDFAARREAQRALGLPVLPTTTIGSFPQTSELRKARAEHRSGALSDEQYQAELKEEVRRVVQLQEEIGIDVLVHGEPERNDMVQYFAELLDGFAVTENGWVQSYGSRCTRPPIIFGDVSRPAPMTVEWSTYAQSLTEKPMKGMLTGPVTILAWSFKRDDVEWATSADQIALALADEVADLEAAGLKVIQIDEPALRELLPLRADARPQYLEWAVRSFRLSTLQAKPETQVHTHLCYSEFGEIIDAVAALDADVTSIEAARSRMELLADLKESFHSEIGPGIWDIHSPRVPSVDELVELLRAALQHVDADRLWVNPDCGLKTRGYAEVDPSLRNMVEARNIVAGEL